MPNNEDNINNVNWREILLVILFGGIGAVALYLIGIVNDTTIAPTISEAIIYFPIGAVAGFLGVYVIARTDTKHFTHCLGLALACGLSWQVVIESAAGIVNQAALTVVSNEVTAIADNSELLIQEVENITGSREAPDHEILKIKTNELIKNVIKINRKSEDINDPMVQIKINKTINDTYKSIDEIKEVNPELGDEALNTIYSILGPRSNYKADAIYLRTGTWEARNPILLPGEGR